MRIAAMLVGLMATAAAVACSGGGASVTRPTSSPQGFGGAALSQGAPRPAAPLFGSSVVDLGTCLRGSGGPACFSASRFAAQAPPVAGAIVPGVPINLGVSVS